MNRYSKKLIYLFNKYQHSVKHTFKANSKMRKVVKVPLVFICMHFVEDHFGKFRKHGKIIISEIPILVRSIIYMVTRKI